LVTLASFSLDIVQLSTTVVYEKYCPAPGANFTGKSSEGRPVTYQCMDYGNWDANPNYGSYRFHKTPLIDHPVGQVFCFFLVAQAAYSFVFQRYVIKWVGENREFSGADIQAHVFGVLHLVSYFFLGIPELVCCFIIVTLKTQPYEGDGNDGQAGGSLNCLWEKGSQSQPCGSAQVSIIDTLSLSLSLLEYPYMCGVLLRALRFPIFAFCVQCIPEQTYLDNSPSRVPCMFPDFLAPWLVILSMMYPIIYLFVFLNNLVPLLGPYAGLIWVIYGISPFQFISGYFRKLSLVLLMSFIPWVEFDSSSWG